jgi:phosphoglycolate phosphatase-like HAD superfamily hydrolase
VTYVGDGVWDFQAAQRLGWNFIGIGAGDAAARLMREGAAAVLPNFSSSEEFFYAISKAAIRRQPSGV